MNFLKSVAFLICAATGTSVFGMDPQVEPQEILPAVEDPVLSSNPLTEAPKVDEEKDSSSIASKNPQDILPVSANTLQAQGPSSSDKKVVVSLESQTPKVNLKKNTQPQSIAIENPRSYPQERHAIELTRRHPPLHAVARAGWIFNRPETLAEDNEETFQGEEMSYSRESRSIENNKADDGRKRNKKASQKQENQPDIKTTFKNTVQGNIQIGGLNKSLRDSNRIDFDLYNNVPPIHGISVEIGGNISKKRLAQNEIEKVLKNSDRLSEFSSMEINKADDGKKRDKKPSQEEAKKDSDN